MYKLFRFRYIFLLSILILLVLSALHLKDLGFKYHLEEFFPEEDPELEFLNTFRSQLEPDDAYVRIAIEHNSSIFNPAFLSHLDSFTQSAGRLPYIISAASITTLSDYIKTPFGFTSLPLVHSDNNARLKEDSIKLYQDPRWLGNLFSADARAAMVVLKTAPDLPQEQAVIVVDSLARLIQDFGYTQYHVVSRPHIQTTFVSAIEGELKLYVALAIGLLVIIMILVFRTFWGVAIPLVSSLSGLLLFMGYLQVIGHEMNIMSVLYPVLLLTIGMSDVIHIMNKYIEEQEKGHGRFAAMEKTIREIGLATFLTSLATATGFLAALTVPIAPIREFSFNAAVGVMITYVNVLFLTTSLLLYFKAPSLMRKRRKARGWQKIVQNIYLSGRNYPRRVAWLSVLVLLLSAYGIYNISTNTILLTDVPKEDKLREDFRFFEQKLNGARPFDVAVLPQEGHKLSDLPVLYAIDTVQAYLRQHKDLGAVMSPADLYKSMHKAYNGGSQQAYQLPGNQAQADEYARLSASTAGDMVNILQSADGRMGRITGRMHDLGSDRVKELFDSLSIWALAHTDTSMVKFHITGTSLIIDRNNDYLRENLFEGLIFAFLAIGLMMALMFRSFKMMLISLVPNVFPLVICGAVMGFAGIELKASTAIIFEIVFGIAVNDTIHFLTQYKLETSKGHTVDIAIRNTFRETGKAIILTTVILFAGISTLATSSFSTTLYIGILMSVAFISAVLADLYVLPLLLRWVYQRKGKEAKSNL